jgi:ribosome maturation factor RimP
MTATTELDRIRTVVEPIASDLRLDLYDLERRGATVRVTLDTPPGSHGGVTLDTLSLATRLISRELDHADPVAGQYTLEVTSPGLERPLRQASHFQREVGKEISVRLRDPAATERRIQGTLADADERGFTLVRESGDRQVLAYADVDKARTVFDWAPKPKPGKKSAKQNKSDKSATGAPAPADRADIETEKQSS